MNRTVGLYGPVEKTTGDEVAGALVAMSQQGFTPITLEIDSPGGIISVGNIVVKAIRAIQASNIVVEGVAVGMVGSMAFRIFQHCEWRDAMPNAKFMIHGAKIETGARIDWVGLDAYIEGLRVDHEYFMRYLAQRCHQPLETCLQWSRTEQLFSADEALDAGIVDFIRLDYRPRRASQPVATK